MNAAALVEICCWVLYGGFANLLRINDENLLVFLPSPLGLLYALITRLSPSP